MTTGAGAAWAAGVASPAATTATTMPNLADIRGIGISSLSHRQGDVTLGGLCAASQEFVEKLRESVD
ncbi:hypothetical protein GCM10027184_64440 [Saccharothrix stipae]